MIKQHIRSLLFSLFFAIATLSTALHELSPHHHSDNCPVCVVDEHSLSADIISNTTEDETTSFYEECTFFAGYKQLKLVTTLNARAPPLFFS